MNRDQRVIWDLTGEVQRLHELLLDARDMIRAGIDDYDGVQEDALVGRIEAALAGAAVQPERCCLDYPRCDCNSPAEWPTREEAEKRAAELMAIGRATLAAADSAPDVTCATHGCTYRDGKCIRCWGRDAHSKAIDSLLDDCATVYGGPFPEGTK